MNTPGRITAGDSVEWSESFGKYPAPTWTATLHLNGPTRKTVTATADGSSHKFSVAAATSAAWTPGVYAWAIRVTDGTKVVTVARGGRLVVDRDPTQELPDGDARSHAERVLAAIEAVLEGRATHDVGQYSIGGTQITKMPVQELLAWRTRYKAEVNRERRAERLRRGIGGSTTVRVRNLGRR